VSLPAPYYQDDAVTIYHGDCREIMPEIPMVDLLLTDPPYGIGAARRGRGGRQDGAAVAPSKDYGDARWDDRPVEDSLIAQAVARSRWQIVFGGQFYRVLPPRRCWLVWDKDNGANDYGDCEMAWTNLEGPIRRLRYRWHGMLQEPGRVHEIREHPMQKPLEVIKWAMLKAPSSERVLDPFMGSGTTLRAAKDLGRKAIGIEIEERYAEIAARRMEQEVIPFDHEEQGTRVSGRVLASVEGEESTDADPPMLDLLGEIRAARTAKEVR